MSPFSMLEDADKLASEKANLDALELAQYREIFKKLDALLAREGEIHIAPTLADRIVVRMIDFDGKNEFPVTKPGEHPTGATLRDAMAQAAQVVQ
jgi:hypothetical protein